LTVAHGRQAALGDSLARILRFCGHDLTTEYYNNDEGVQIQTLGKSTEHRVKELLDGQSYEIPENYYRGDYLIGIAKQLLEKIGKDVYVKMSDEKKAETCRLFARDEIMRDIMKDLKEFDTVFDSFYSQEALGKSGKVESTLEELKKRGVVFESEGATWLRSTDFGDDKDRVLVKSDKNYTYLTPDIAYHHEKFKRGFEEIVDILGPDHHGYIARLKASQAALGHDPNCVRVLIAQLVTLYEADKQVRMSTRAGEFVTLRQILDEVGKDAGRFFFVMRKFDAHLDFDLALAKTQTPDNPVFYIQYAHARIESIKKTSAESGIKIPDLGGDHLKRLVNEHEIRLMKLLSQFSDNVLGAERTLEPYRLVPYLMDLAASFHRFYTENRVVTDDVELSQARLLLILATQQVIRTGLHLLGVTAPFKM
jgi:arginyl-tRNA synthetase